MSIEQQSEKDRETIHNISQKLIGNYQLEKTIGEGTFGKVKLGTHTTTGEKVAIKILEKEKILEPEDLERVNREIKFLKRLNHQNVIKIFEILENQRNFYIIMEYASGGELFSYIVSKKRLPCPEAAFFYVQIIKGLEYIHQNNIVHRDLKPENLLLNENKFLKIIDFGLSNEYKDEELLSTPCGSPCYAAPEMIQGKKYAGLSVDIWSSGIILYAIVCGFLPFEDSNNDKLYKKIVQCNLEFPKYLSPNCVDMIKKLLVVDPKKRINLQDIKSHPFFKEGEAQFQSSEVVHPSLLKRIDEKCFSEMSRLGYTKEMIEFNLSKNKHNEITSTYHLLHNKLRKQEILVSSIHIDSSDNNEFTFQNNNIITGSNIHLTTEKEEQTIKPIMKNEAVVHTKDQKGYIGKESNQTVELSHQPTTFKAESKEKDKAFSFFEKKIFEDKFTKEAVKKNNFITESSTLSTKNKMQTFGLAEDKRNNLMKTNIFEHKNACQSPITFENVVNTRNHNKSDNRINSLLTDYSGANSTLKQDTRIFESLSPKQKDQDNPTDFIKLQSNKVKYDKQKNGMLNYIDGHILTEKKIIKNNFKSIKEKINKIRQSVINNEKEENINREHNFETKFMIDNIVTPTNRTRETISKTKFAKIVGKNRQSGMGTIQEDAELIENAHHQFRDMPNFEEKLFGLKKKLRLSNNLITDNLSMTINSGVNRRLENSFQITNLKEKKVSSILETINKVRTPSSLDTSNQPTYIETVQSHTPYSNNLGKISDHMIDKTIDSFSKLKSNFLSKFSSTNEGWAHSKEKNNIHKANSLTQNFDSLKYKVITMPSTAKNSANTTKSLIASNEFNQIKNQKHQINSLQSAVSPKNEEIRFKEKFYGSDGFKLFQANTKENLPLKEDNTGAKLKDKDFEKLRKYVKGREKTISKEKDNQEDSNKPKEFACCNIYNDFTIQDKLVRYSKKQGLHIEQTADSKFECSQDGNVVEVEFTKIGHKGMSFMKMFHLKGKEVVTKQIIKNLIINIGL